MDNLIEWGMSALLESPTAGDRQQVTANYVKTSDFFIKIYIYFQHKQSCRSSNVKTLYRNQCLKFVISWS